MKATCRSQFESALEPLDLEGLALETGFQRRKPKKLTPLIFLQSCCLLLVNTKVSFRNWAVLIGSLINDTYSKQSLFERMGDRAVKFVQQVVLTLVVRLRSGRERVLPEELRVFKRIIDHDSTILTLPKKLRRFFPGARNQHGSLGGMLRVQGYYDIKEGRFLHFSHSAFTRNDFKWAYEIFDFLCAGDLLLRDLGYLVLDVLRRIDALKAFFLSRFKHNLEVFGLDGQRLDLAALLGHRTYPLDKDVLIGAKEQMPVRLVAVKLAQEKANLRRQKARKNRHFHPTKRHLLLLGWDMLFTNVPRQQLCAKAIVKLYGLRSHMETIFKAWKSNFNLEDVPAGSRAEVETLLYARLLLITIFEVCFLARWDYELEDRAGPVSLLKLSIFMRLYLPVTLLSELQLKLEAALQKQVPYHCTYEKRRKRKNFVEKLQLT
jgi:hypothetical protein